MERMKEPDGTRLLRKILDGALVDAPDDVYVVPDRLWDQGGPLPLTTRIVRSFYAEGWEFKSSSANRRQLVDGTRARMDFEDLLDTALIACPGKDVRHMQVNDQARERVAKKVWQFLHQRHVVLRRVRKDAFG